MPQAAERRVWDELTGYLARRLRDPHLAAELTQEAYARRAGLGPDIVVLDERAWLFAVARRLVIDHWRGARQVPGYVEADAALRTHASDDPSPEARLLSREEIRVLERAVDALPPRTREVFRLHKFEELSYQEVADRLGMAKNTVVVHMVKALAHCRAAMKAHRARI